MGKYASRCGGTLRSSHTIHAVPSHLPIKAAAAAHWLLSSVPRPPSQFIDAHGMEEAGVDGGGLFKEFLEMVGGLVQQRRMGDCVA